MAAMVSIVQVSHVNCHMAIVVCTMSFAGKLSDASYLLLVSGCTDVMDLSRFGTGSCIYIGNITFSSESFS